MKLAPLKVRTSDVNVTRDPVRMILSKLVQEGRSTTENAHQLESGIMFARIKEIRFTWISSPRALQAYFPEVGIVPILGGSTVVLPNSLKNKKRVLNILNKDQFCFRYAMVAWLTGKSDDPHAARPSHNIENAPLRRPPKDFVP